MAFGIKRAELIQWKQDAAKGNIAILTHYWQDERFHGSTSVTKIGCVDLNKLVEWGNQYELKADCIHYGEYPHYDVFGEKQNEFLNREGMESKNLCFRLYQKNHVLSCLYN